MYIYIYIYIYIHTCGRAGTHRPEKGGAAPPFAQLYVIMCQ